MRALDRQASRFEMELSTKMQAAVTEAKSEVQVGQQQRMYP